MKSKRKITKKEIAIIKAAQKGNIKAFNRLFNKYHEFVSKVIYQYLKDIDESREVANMMFLKVYNKLSEFKVYDSFGGWLRIMANRTAIDYLRSIKHDPVVLDDFEERLAENDSISSDECDLVNRITYERVIKEFKEFPNPIRKILEMFYVDNLTTDQISKILDIPEGTIKSHLSRTRKKLQKTFKQV